MVRHFQALYSISPGIQEIYTQLFLFMRYAVNHPIYTEM
jgi:hypothetical protein